jgi:hypothetical protein
MNGDLGQAHRTDVTVHRASQSIESSSQKSRSSTHGCPNSFRDNFRLSAEAVQVPERRQQCHAAVYSNDFGHQRLPIPCVTKLADLANARIDPRRTNQRAASLRDTANPAQ